MWNRFIGINRMKTRIVKHISTPLLVIIAILALQACGGSKRTGSSNNALPAWVSQPSSAFSDRQYLMAVGSGDTFNEARSDAMLALAQIFRANVEGTQNLYSDVLEVSKSNDDFTSKETIRLINNIAIGATEDLQNAEVLTSGTGKDGMYYVLAGFNRNQTAALYRNEINNNNERIERNKEEIERSNDKFSTLRFLKENLLLARINKQLAGLLEIIMPGSGESSKTQNTLIESRNAFNAHQQTMPVRIRGLQSVENIRSALSDAFLQEGFVLAEKNPVLLVDATYRAREIDINRDDAEFVSWELQIKITRPETQQTYTDFNVSGREGALNIQNAYKRAATAAIEQIEARFRPYFNAEFLSNN